MIWPSSCQLQVDRGPPGCFGGWCERVFTHLQLSSSSLFPLSSIIFNCVSSLDVIISSWVGFRTRRTRISYSCYSAPIVTVSMSVSVSISVFVSLSLRLRLCLYFSLSVSVPVFVSFFVSVSVSVSGFVSYPIRLVIYLCLYVRCVSLIISLSPRRCDNPAQFAQFWLLLLCRTVLYRIWARMKELQIKRWAMGRGVQIYLY